MCLKRAHDGSACALLSQQCAIAVAAKGHVAECAQGGPLRVPVAPVQLERAHQSQSAAASAHLARTS